MAIRVALHHRTSYQYDRAVNIFPQIVRLRPAPHSRTPVLSYSLKITPAEHFCNWQQDPHSNYLARLVFPEKAERFSVEVDLVAELTVINPFDFFLEPSAERWPFKYEPWLAEELRPHLSPSSSPRLDEFLASVPRDEKRVVDFLVDVNSRVKQAVNYVVRLDPGVQTCEETLTKASGSCRDSAWLLVQVLRNLGVAARFVSGYLIQLVPDVVPLEGPTGAARDFTDLHAWTEVYLPGAGWIGLDPTSGLFAGEGHIPLACTPRPDDAAPITGGVDPCECKFDFDMSIQRIHEDPRVTKPYTEPQWQEIEALGHRIDAEMESAAVRLTMGGEPTFVSIDDMDGDEWNIAAHGPNKRKLSGEMIKRMRERFSPGGLLHFGQGKWYPGEPLPRWALNCFWRKDGVPLWHDPTLIADDGGTNFGDGEASKFVAALTERLGAEEKHIIPAYEDSWHYLWKERQLPVNVDPLNSRLEDPLERANLTKVFERGLGAVAGYVLPIKPSTVDGATRWESGPWFLRQEHLFLMPGDSPIGFRLPLDSLPWVAKEDREYDGPIDPFAPRGPLPDGDQYTRHYSANGTLGSPGANGASGREGNGYITHQPRIGVAATQAVGAGGGIALATWEYPAIATAPFTFPLPGQSAAQLIRTALCVEARDGVLHVFFPPVQRLEDYLDLVGAVEATAEELELPVVVEGYPPPRDHRLRHLSVTPDPGVIEVNIHPAHSWGELVDNTVGLYEDARLCRLGAEKFNLDGKHTGTCGGNHIVIGGPTPADSPILRRPDLLGSLVAYWNNHPALSYLFSGAFIGPTSQAPRVDEGRHDNLYELEIARKQIPQDGAAPPWLVDRLFRHLLVDVTGNTHRAEFCIDKLFSPDSSSGRLGLLEFRGFEMPPHPRMSLSQQLLLRALVAWFWKEPYTSKLVRWGTSLHDRFMLPHFVDEDLRDVLGQLQRAGYPLQREWFDPHFEFRFPLIGTIDQRSIHLELRNAIEPWNVLGEEPGGGGTVRYVDSSLERLQVRVDGLTGDRHVITCNGRRVPLHPTGVIGQAVAGVRYRAWQPPGCLHPTIGVHTPLVFDVFDTWNDRSIGGCTFHVAHPGGLSYETFPVNSYEAESRRASRFFKFGHTPGVRPLRAEAINPDFPMTLDLRYGTQPAKKT